MRNGRLNLLVVVLGLFVIAAPLLAHHGSAAYEMKNQMTIKGTVKDFQFVNPHVLIFMDVKTADGSMEQWQGELTSPNRLARAGWTRSTLKPGMEITVTGGAAKVGHSLWIQKILDANGDEMNLAMGD